MTRKKLKLIAVVLVAMLVLTFPAYGILGVGDIVYDPINEIHFIAQVANQAVQIDKAVAQVTQLVNTYNHLVFQAKQIVGKGGWRTPIPIWVRTVASDPYGTAGPWIGTVNSGASAESAIARAIERTGVYGPALGSIPQEARDRVQRQYGQVAVMGGTLQRLLQTIGAYRGTSGIHAGVISKLESKVESDDPNDNTQVAIENQMSGSLLMMLKNTEAANDMIGSQLEATAAQLAFTQEAIAQRINTDIEFRENAASAVTKHATGTTTVLSGFHFPTY